MRKYIFTEVERRRLKAWLENGEEDRNTQKDFVKVRRNLSRLKRDVELLSCVAQRLKTEGRIMNRVRFPIESDSPSQHDESR